MISLVKVVLCKINIILLFFSAKVSLIIADTDWSDKFSLDTVGSSGNIQCKSKSNTYEVSKHS